MLVFKNFFEIGLLKMARSAMRLFSCKTPIIALFIRISPYIIGMTYGGVSSRVSHVPRICPNAPEGPSLMNETVDMGLISHWISTKVYKTRPLSTSAPFSLDFFDWFVFATVLNHYLSDRDGLCMIICGHLLSQHRESRIPRLGLLQCV